MREREDTKTPLFEDWKAKKETIIQRAKIPEKNRMLWDNLTFKVTLRHLKFEV